MTVTSFIGIGRARLGAVTVTALVLAFAWVPMANARQSSTGDAAAKPATATKPKTTSNSAATKSTSKTHTSSSSAKHSRKKSAKVRGQQKIDSERAQAIQEALIREHYMTGEASGTWNQASEDAMRKYQADHGWQSKTVPDSRALIKLGLGPSNDHLLNPESAMTTVPDAPHAASLPTTSHSATPTADSPSSNQSTPNQSTPTGPQ